MEKLENLPRIPRKGKHGNVKTELTPPPEGEPWSILFFSFVNNSPI